MRLSFRETKATKELNEHSWVEEAGKHPLPYGVGRERSSEEELAHWWKVLRSRIGSIN